MRTVLLTGFEPFGGERVNPSWQAVSLLGERQPLSGVDIRVAVLPCAFDTSLDALRAAVTEHSPELVICTGQAGGRHAVTPERVAVNLDDARIPDNAGSQPVDVPVVEGGPAAYFTSLPVKASVAAMRAAGVPAAVSYTAGTFVCNHVFYGLMHLLATELPGVRGGFVHVPYTPEQLADAPSMSVATIAEGLAALVRTCLDTVEDLSVPAGTLH
ncbi:pyroglutamyl-peptidase I [Kutzneria viridogrisea]|uniref:Pyrrolidone-carboxylate peptidase n=2 Tax=Kutzneria TaxID=43356 RepID=W5WDE9_9PSEU|nr:pyroglutamyl-peptidase I [Kutzneria albida]AHH96214.1 Pyrrolidone-carboxylate peptidase [Kutzneria albida DSM 43870]MBA8928573.1 pyroglutamyl-peptidase [Kutzneria viridogrisea]